MQSPGLYDFRIFKGTTLRKSFVWKPAGVAANLSGYGAVAALRAGKLLDSTPPVVSLTIGNGGITVDPSAPPSLTAGTIQLYMTSAATLGLVLPVYYYFVHTIAPNGDVLSFLEGKITVLSSNIP